MSGSESKYSASTFARAHGVRRRKVRLDLMLGFQLKQLIGIMRPNISQP